MVIMMMMPVGRLIGMSLFLMLLLLSVNCYSHGIIYHHHHHHHPALPPPPPRRPRRPLLPAPRTHIHTSRPLVADCMARKESSYYVTLRKPHRKQYNTLHSLGYVLPPCLSVCFTHKLDLVLLCFHSVQQLQILCR